jgi:hypothetical protein
MKKHKQNKTNKQADPRKSRLATYGNVMISTPTDVLTVGDIRDFLTTLYSMGISDTNILLDGFLTYEFQSTSVEMIECAEHKANEPRQFDWIVKAHDCDIW